MKKPAASVTELLSSLVRIPSVNKFISGRNDAEHDVAAYLDMCAKKFGLRSRFLEVPGAGSNLLITREFSGKSPWIMFAAHMDTVSSDGMETDPFGGEEKNGRIYGRGSCDDKGSIAAALWALKETGSSPNNIALLLTIDEEQRRNGAGFFAEKQLPALGFMPLGVIVAEPTSLKPVVAHAGIGHFSVIVHGKAAHAADPSKGRSAIKDMVKVMDAIEKNYINRLTATDPLCGKAQCSINMISGGRQVNAIPDECTIRVDRRVMPGEDVKGIIPAVEKALEPLRKEDPSIKFSISPEFSDSPLSQDLSHPFILGTLACLERSGLDAAPIGAQFATDAGALSGAGLACVVLGPGEDHLAHTANESIGVNELEEGVRIFKAMMTNNY
jgi:acetylornithine deacetylase